MEVKAKFLKDKQALRMTSVELKLLQQIVEAKAEEKSYEQSNLQSTKKLIRAGINFFSDEMHVWDTLTSLKCFFFLCCIPKNLEI